MNISGLLSRQFLTSIGVELDDDTYIALSQHYGDTLRERIVSEIVDELEPEQLEYFHILQNASSDDVKAWLIKNVKDFDEIVEDEIAILLGEIAENSTKI